MMGLGFVEVLMIALLGGGMSSNDLVAVVQPKDYFESRNVRLSIDSMIDVAIRDPKDGKSQVMQLTALRYLTDESDAFKKAANYASNREAIEEIASGKRGQDKAGFSKEYAQRLLDKLDGKKALPTKQQPMRADALDWFPADVTFAGALDLRATGGGDSIQALLKMMPEREKREMYNVIEKIGNIRIERVAFAYTDGAKESDGRFYLRATGKGSQDGLATLFNELNGDRFQTKTLKADDGTKVTLIQREDHGPPVIMLIGNTDVLLVGTERPDSKQEELVQAVLNARANPKKSAAAGAFKDGLGKLPEKAVGYLIGEIPSPAKQQLERGYGLVPAKGLVYLERTQQGIQVTAEGTMKNADEADKLVQKIGDDRKAGIAELQRAMQRQPPREDVPIPFQAMLNVLEGMQVQSQQDRVNVRISAPMSLFQQLPMFFFGTTTKRVEKKF